MSYLLDTNVVSELTKPHCDPSVREWSDSLNPENVYLSVLVIGEIRRGIERLLGRHDESQARRFSEWFDELRHTYASRIVPVDASIALVWGRMSIQHPTLTPIDGLMAATAYLNDWTFVTRNTKDVTNTGVRLLNPFTPT